MEDRVARVQESAVRGHHSCLRRRGRTVSAVRLPSTVAVLVGAGPRSAEGNRAAQRALHAGRDRLFQQLLRPAGAPASRRRHPAAARRQRAALDAAASREALPPSTARTRRLPRSRRIERAGARAARPGPLRSGDQRAAVRAEGVGQTRRRFEATLAWIYQKQGQSEKGWPQFTLYRASINTMKRAYPQYLTASGEPPAEGCAAPHFSARLLGSDPEVLGREPARSVSRRGAGRAGVHVCAPTFVRRPRPWD